MNSVLLLVSRRKIELFLNSTEFRFVSECDSPHTALRYLANAYGVTSKPLTICGSFVTFRGKLETAVIAFRPVPNELTWHHTNNSPGHAFAVTFPSHQNTPVG